MAIYTCPKCNKRYFLDNKTQQSSDFQKTFKCEFCGTGYNNHEPDLNPNVENKQDVPNKSYSETLQHNTDASIPNNDMQKLIQLQYKQLETLESIKGMLKFFVVLTIIGLIISILIPLV